MADYYRIKGETLTSIADAIRSKKESTAVFSPEQMATEIDGIVIGDNLPDAEKSAFGTLSGAEYGIISDVTFAGSYGTEYTYGYRFTPTTEFAFAGFRYCPGNKGAGTHVFRLWDADTQAIITELTVNGVASYEWAEARVNSPINLEVGKTYVVSRYGPSCYQNGAVTYNSKLSNAQTVYNKAFRHSFPNNSLSTGTYGIDIIIVPVATETVITEYKIQVNTANRISDEVRRIIGTSEQLTMEQIVTALQGIASTA